MYYTRNQLQQTQHRITAANVAIAVNNKDVQLPCECCNSIVTLRTFIKHHRDLIAPVSSSSDPRAKRCNFNLLFYYLFKYLYYIIVSGLLLQSQLNSILHSVPVAPLQPLFHDTPDSIHPLGILEEENDNNTVSAIDEQDELNAISLDNLHIGILLFYFLKLNFRILTLI